MVVEHKSKKPCVILVATRGFALSNSRRLLIRRMLGAGYHVVIATSADDYSQSLTEEGVTLVPVCFGRGGVAPYRDVMALIDLWRAYRRFRPILIHHFNAKPLIIGSLAARWALRSGQCKIVNTVTGLGHAFIKDGFIRALAGFGYKLISPTVAVTIFQNRDDQALFLAQSWVKKSQSRLVTGSGVDIDRFLPRQEVGVSGQMCVLMVSRLLKQKGVIEYIEMAEILKKQYKHVRFQLGGEMDKRHPDAISQELIDQAVERGIIEYIGYVDALEKRLGNASIFVFPSYYREGVPRVVMESAASGVPVVGADVPGTREAIKDSITGFLVPARDSQALADRVGQLINNSALRRKMGIESRRMAESCFDIRVITQQQLAIYGEFGVKV